MSVNGKWGSIFEIICVSIIYHVRIISIANMSGGFMVSDTLSLLNAYQIVHDNSVMFNRDTYLYCYLYKTPTTPCAQDIILNHFVILKLLKSYQQTLIVKFIMVIVVIMNIP